MKKIYFAGKFNINKDESLPLEVRLKDDFRARLLGDPSKLSLYSDGVMLSENACYFGPFYCEKASEGEYTSTDCQAVLSAEWNAVNNADCYVAVFGESFSVGTVVELGWALNLDKEIYIIYKKEESRYSIGSEYWFAIADAVKRGKSVKLFTYECESQIIDYIKREVIGE